MFWCRFHCKHDCAKAIFVFWLWLNTCMLFCAKALSIMEFIRVKIISLNVMEFARPGSPVLWCLMSKTWYKFRVFARRGFCFLRALYSSFSEIEGLCSSVRKKRAGYPYRTSVPCNHTFLACLRCGSNDWHIKLRVLFIYISPPSPHFCFTFMHYVVECQTRTGWA